MRAPRSRKTGEAILRGEFLTCDPRRPHATTQFLTVPSHYASTHVEPLALFPGASFRALASMPDRGLGRRLAGVEVLGR